MSTTSTEYTGNLLAGTGIRPLSRGTEYREWRLAVIDILAEKGYWNLVSQPSPTDTTDIGFSEKSGKARGLLGRLLDSNHRELYATERNPRQLWLKLESRYAGKDQARIWYLRGELSQVRYNDEPMVDYIAKLQKLFNQLTGAGEQQSEKDKQYVLLANLPLQYHPFRTSIINNEKGKEISYDDLCDRLILEHQQLTGDIGKPLGGSNSSSGAFFSAGHGRGRFGKGRGRSTGRFTNSRQPGTRTGYDTRANTHSRTGSGYEPPRVDKDSCLYCKEKGHWARNCPKKIQSGSNSANAAKGKVIGAWMATTEGPNGTQEWILDSGATHHMSSQRELFRDFSTHTASISIANGGTISATGIGEIWITVRNSKGDEAPIRLREVLYVLRLGPNNLVSVRCNVNYGDPAQYPDPAHC